MRDLILARPTTLLRRIMRPNVKSVPATMDQEQVARLFRKHGYLALPVVDERNRLLGLITVDDVVAVVGVFAETVRRWVVLAFYMPIIAGMGGNASAQAMAVAVRGIALGQVDRSLLGRVMVRQFLVGLMTGLVIGFVTGAIALVFHHQQGVQLAAVVTVALIINHCLATVSGAAIPFIMKSMGFDPAQSATIFATTVTDVGGFFSLLGLAALFLR